MWDPSSQNFARKRFQDVGVFVHICVGMHVEECVCVCVCCNFPVSITSSLGLGSSWLSLWSYEGEGGHSTLLLLPPAVPSFGAVMYIRGREGQGVVPLLGECGTRGWA